MKTLILTATALGMSAAPALADTLTIEDFVGRVEVQTGAYTEISAEFTPGSASEDPEIDTSRNGVEIDGHAPGALACRTRGGEIQIRLGRFGGYDPISDFPVLRITAPVDTVVELDDSIVVGRIGDIAEGDISPEGCSELIIGNVAGDLSLGLGGSGSLQAGDIGGELDVSLAGSGEVMTGDVGGGADASVAGSGRMSIGRVQEELSVSIAGSGDFYAASLDGDLDVSIAGSGDVEIGGGTAESVEVSIMGSGDLVFDGVAERAEITVAGSGDVDLGDAEDTDVTVLGSGAVTVAGERTD